MKPKPYTAKPWEARAFAERRKTLIVLPEPALAGFPAMPLDKIGECINGAVLVKSQIAPDDTSNWVVKCPLHIGQRYYVRETWRLADAFIKTPLSHFNDPEDVLGEYVRYAADDIQEHFAGQYRSFTQMPQWAARTHFEVVAVQCKRVREIAYEQVLACGIEPSPMIQYGNRIKDTIDDWLGVFGADHPGVWAANQWCWFIECEVEA
jgi:hypothetical protein